LLIPISATITCPTVIRVNKILQAYRAPTKFLTNIFENPLCMYAV
jgi:hypothetical protein